MASKKYYAVKKGSATGIFSSWEECKASVDGYPGAKYKGFGTLAEAEEYMNNTNGNEKGSTGKPKEKQTGKPTEKSTEKSTKKLTEKSTKKLVEHKLLELPPKGALLSYVDGSYEDSLKKYGFGCVFILEDGRIYTEYGNGDNPDSLPLRNVTGEMLGAMYAVKFAMINGFKAIEIRYDYQGIEKWVTGEWKSKKELTQKYTAAMREWSKSIEIKFTKVVAHTNVQYNELADQMAKKGLTEGNGVPKVRRIEEMEIWNGLV